VARPGDFFSFIGEAGVNRPLSESIFSSAMLAFSALFNWRCPRLALLSD
jgi:hypothetical protein